MDWVLVLRWLHIIGATILLGTGVGIAFFMVMAVRSRSPQIVAHTASVVVVADWVFTASAVIIQPVTGYLLAREIGWPLNAGWIVWSIGLYVLIGLFWLPVIWIQHRMRDLARVSASTNSPLSKEFLQLYRIWFMCGFPAFFAVIAIIWLMVSRPPL